MKESKINDKKCWIIFDTRDMCNHYVHVSYHKETEARMILEGAANGVITSKYPVWVQKSIYLPFRHRLLGNPFFKEVRKDLFFVLG